MKVCMLTTSYPRYTGDPSSPFVEGLCKWLARNGVEVHVVAPHDSATATKEFEKINGVHVHRFHYFWPRALQKVAYGKGGMPENIRKSLLAKAQLPFFMLSFLKKAKEVSRECDLIHAQWAPSGLIASKVAGKKPVVLYVHGAEVFVNFARGLVKKAIESADFVLFNSSYTQKKTLEIAKPKKHAVIPSGIALEKFNARVPAGKARKKLGIAEKERIIFSLGRMVERKGFEYLVKALPEVKEKAKLVLGGEGPEKKALQELVKELNLTKQVIFAGRIPQKILPYYYRDCDLFVLPAIVDSKGDTEGLGLVLAEAMASGKPVIASKVGGIVDVVDDGENGFLVGQKNPKALAEKINQIFSNPALAKKMAANGIKKARTVFNWNNTAKEVIGIYNQLLGKREIEEYYGKKFFEGYENLPPYEKYRRENISSAILELIEARPGQKLVDLGCGSGELLNRLQGKGLKLAGCDISKAGFNKIKGKLELKQADLEKPLPYASNSFDFAVLREVLEHIENKEGLLKEINRILKKNGKLVVSTPSRHGLIWPFYKVKKKMGTMQPIEDWFTPLELEELMEKAGLKIEKFKSIHFMPYHSALPQKLVPAVKKIDEKVHSRNWSNSVRDASPANKMGRNIILRAVKK